MKGNCKIDIQTSGDELTRKFVTLVNNENLEYEFNIALMFGYRMLDVRNPNYTRYPGDAFIKPVVLNLKTDWDLALMYAGIKESQPNIYKLDVQKLRNTQSDAEFRKLLYEMLNND